MGYKEGGWQYKYIVEKVDGSLVDPEAEYFVLRLDKDPHARIAALAYADSVETDNSIFTADIRAHVAKSLKLGKFLMGLQRENARLKRIEAAARAYTKAFDEAWDTFWETQDEFNALRRALDEGRGDG